MTTSLICFNLQAHDLEVTLTSDPQQKPDNNKLVFGHEMTDHMLEIDWSDKSGWSRPVIKPIQDIRLHPAAKVFHYAPELYEGLKAYRGPDNKVRLFRPMENMSRMAATAERASLPVSY